MKPDDRIVLAAGLRLPQARAGGAYAKEDAGHLAVTAARELIARSGIDAGQLDEVILGCVGPPHDQANIARVVALRAGVPEHVPAFTVARNCASGMQAVTSAITKIEAGRGDLFLAGGVEVMSAYPLVYNDRARGFFGRMLKARTMGAKLSALASLRPSMFFAPRVTLTEGLTDPTNDLIMGSTAENLARDWGLSREEADAYALQSHQRAAAAQENGRLAREIIPHVPLGSKPGSASLAHDDGVRPDQTLKALAKLKPYFEKPDGVVTVGNACGITDGAAMLLVTTASRAKSLGLKPLASVRSFAWAGCDPSRMGLGPVHASARAMADAGVELSDMGAVEINEAFAVQVQACQRAFASDSFCAKQFGRKGALGELDPDKLNPNGGAIAMGHPVGATGARLLLTMAHELEVGDHELGLATLCIGGGQGGAVVLERCTS